MSTTYEPEPEVENATGNASTVDVDAFLELNLGRRYRSVAESVALVVVYCVIFLTGIGGNVCTCIVIVRNKRMHTATNYYLFSLAVSDLLTLIFGEWPPLSPVYLPVLGSIYNVLNLSVSVLCMSTEGDSSVDSLLFSTGRVRVQVLKNIENMIQYPV